MHFCSINSREIGQTLTGNERGRTRNLVKRDWWRRRENGRERGRDVKLEREYTQDDVHTSTHKMIDPMRKSCIVLYCFCVTTKFTFDFALPSYTPWCAHKYT